MAAKLMQYYQYVAEYAGITGRTQLAIKTKIPSTRAAMEPDSPEAIRMFKVTIEEITGKAAPQY